MNKQEIKDVWKSVFPESHISLSNGHFITTTIYGSGFLANDQKEVAYGIIQNDPLSYRFYIEGKSYREDAISLACKPVHQYLCFENKNLRRKSIGAVTPDKLRKRFEQIKEFISKHKTDLKDDLLFDIDSKLRS
jgi:hypothetical protein